MSAGRKQQILEVLARELESKPGLRLTTASLAQAVGVSEAALYRHFPSKAKMFDALIDFAENAVFGLIATILAEQISAPTRCAQIGSVLLQFAERNPGIARILIGDILLGEHERLRARVAQFFERIEAQLRQILREAVASSTRPQPDRATVNAAANLVTAVIIGRIGLFVRSSFRLSPTALWDDQWAMLERALFSVN
ncbi:MAG: nucleoid occlusion factor SlmA [Gammaproteobacteria bacterium]|nr:nucleoid occlusion factor SlmA [Gammaproteobacteria bacterium]